MFYQNNKKGDLLVNVFVVIITLIVFFALWPAVKALLDVAIAVNAGADPVLDFMMSIIGFVIIFGVIKWVFGTVGGGQDA